MECGDKVNSQGFCLFIAVAECLVSVVDLGDFFDTCVDVYSLP